MGAARSQAPEVGVARSQAPEVGAARSQAPLQLTQFLQQHGYNDCHELREGKNALHLAVSEAKHDRTMEVGLSISSSSSSSSAIP